MHECPMKREEKKYIDRLTPLSLSWSTSLSSLKNIIGLSWKYNLICTQIVILGEKIQLKPLLDVLYRLQIRVASIFCVFGTGYEVRVLCQVCTRVDVGIIVARGGRIRRLHLLVRHHVAYRVVVPGSSPLCTTALIAPTHESGVGISLW